VTDRKRQNKGKGAEAKRSAAATVYAIDVAIDGKTIGVCVPPAGGSFVVFVGNIPRSHMRVQVLSGTETESWSWQLADVRPGEALTLRMIKAPVGAGLAPGRISPREPRVAASRNAQRTSGPARKRRRAR
jgi:hypothetical protein